MQYHPLIGSLQQSLQKALQEHYPNSHTPIVIETPKNPDHGDFSCNIAMLLAKTQKKNPSEIAEKIIQSLHQQNDCIANEITLAKPGFINLRIADKKWMDCLPDLYHDRDHFFRPDIGKSRSVYLEYVSSNPTGPLHIGHGRCGAIGSSLALLFAEIGFKTHKEYFINDAGRQIHILATSVWLRHLQDLNIPLNYPKKAYQGSYISDMSKDLLESKKLLPTPLAKNITTISQATPSPDQDEAWLDQCINEYQKANTTSDRNIFEKACVDFVLDMIKQECIDFNVPFDQWFSEKSLVTDGSVDASIQALKSGGHIYEKDGAVWFKSQALGDDKDRVLVKANGDYTYFATDIAYHWHKLQSKPDNIIDIMGADHHGYIPRLRAALIGLGMKPSQFHAIIYQFITLTQNGQQVQMSTRQGSYITLADLIKEVGLDCARFYLLQKKPDQHITFDLNIAKKESLDNPVYKIHYAHARICSVLAKLTEKTPSYNPDYQLNKAEKGLIQILTRYPDVLASCARDHTLHHLCQYLLELASQLHSYYSSTKIIQEDLDIQASRHYLILCIAKVIRHGMKILGLKAKDKM